MSDKPSIFDTGQFPVINIGGITSTQELPKINLEAVQSTQEVAIPDSLVVQSDTVQKVEGYSTRTSRNLIQLGQPFSAPQFDRELLEGRERFNKQLTRERDLHSDEIDFGKKIHDVLKKEMKIFGIDVPEFDQQRVIINNIGNVNKYKYLEGAILLVRNFSAYSHEALHWLSVHRPTSKGLLIGPVMADSRDGLLKNIQWLNEAIVAELDEQIKGRHGLIMPSKIYEGTDRDINGLDNDISYLFDGKIPEGFLYHRLHGVYSGHADYTAKHGSIMRQMLYNVRSFFHKNPNANETLIKMQTLKVTDLTNPQLVTAQDIFMWITYNAFALDERSSSLQIIMDDIYGKELIAQIIDVSNKYALESQAPNNPNIRLELMSEEARKLHKQLMSLLTLEF